jgi:hypothetical protein
VYDAHVLDQSIRESAKGGTPMRYCTHSKVKIDD